MFDRTLTPPPFRPASRARHRRAFTLLEIIVVVTIIALLATLVAPRLLSRIGTSKVNVAKAEVSSIYQQVNLWMLDSGNSTLPDDFELTLLTEGTSPVIDADDLLDPWGNPYQIVSPGSKNPDFDVISYGAVGEAGGEGENVDIVN